MASIFREEEYVYINDILVSRNGFKNLTFETSKFSNTLSPLRSVGGTLNENNMNTIDTLNVEFYVDGEELANIAYIYTQFKIVGALPLRNKYIIDKIKDSFSAEVSIIDFKESSKSGKTIDSLLVFLNEIKITSLEKTDNGYSVYMRFVLHNEFFTDTERITYSNLFKEWSEAVDFDHICKEPINREVNRLKQLTPLEVEIFNIEKLNAKFKKNFILGAGKTNDMEDEDVERLEERLSVLDKWEELDKHYTLSIPGKHISQIEFISTNMIAGIPIVGKSIPSRCTLGIGPTHYNVKLVFDESDNKLLQEIKSLSDRNIGNHKIQLIHPLVNLFDFKSAIVKNIIFNNIESFNGVMVTIQFQVSGYSYNSDKDNLGLLSTNVLKKHVKETNYAGSYLESLIECVNKFQIKEDEDYKVIVSLLSKVVQNDMSAGIEKSNTFFSKTVNIIYKVRLAHYLSCYASEAITPCTIKCDVDDPVVELQKLMIHTVEGSKATLAQAHNYSKQLNAILADFTSIFTHYSEMMEGIKKAGTEKENDVSSTYLQALLSKLTSEPKNYYARELPFIEISSFYSYCDIIALLSVGLDKEVRAHLSENLNKPEAIRKLVDKIFDNLFEYCYSANFSKQDLVKARVDMILFRELYLKAYRALNTGMFATLTNELIEDNDFQYVDSSLRFKKIHAYIKRYIEDFFVGLMKLTNDEMFIERIVDEIWEIGETKTQSHYDNRKYLKSEVEEYIKVTGAFYKKIFKSDSEDLINYSYNIFLSKYLFITSSLKYSKNMYMYNQENDFTLLIKTLIVSSSLLGFFNLKSEYRTDDYGDLFIGATHQLSEMIKVYFGISNQYTEENNKISVEALRKPECFFPKGYKILKKESYYDEKIDLSKIYPTLVEQKQNFLSKKDYNFLYGTKIENLYPEHIVNRALSNEDEFDSIHHSEDFVQEYRDKFMDSENKINRWIPIPQKNLMRYMPTISHIMRAGKYISNVMKKRIIGHRDVFTNFQTIARVINDNKTRTIPDYEVLIKTEVYNNKYTGASKMIDAKSVIGMNNVINISIAKNSTKKIKTATVTLLDMNKEAIEYTNEESIGLINKTNDELEILKINSGAEIEIYLGFSEDKRLVYKGFINKIQTFNNVVKFECVDIAAMLHGFKIAHMNLRGDRDASQSGFLDMATVAVRWLLTNKEMTSINSNISRNRVSAVVNDHLFHYPTNTYFNDSYDGKEYGYIKKHFEEDGEDLANFFLPKQSASMYNVAATCIALLPFNVLKYLDASNYVGKKNSLLDHMKRMEKINETFGDMRAGNDVTRQYDLPSNVLSGLNNVDCDFDTYGAFASKMDAEFVSHEEVNEYGVSTDLSKSDQIWVTHYIKYDILNEEFDKNVIYPEYNRVKKPEMRISPLQSFSSKYIPPSSSMYVTSIFKEFRPRRDGDGYHYGVDIAPLKPEDYSLVAIADSIVLACGKAGSYGNRIVLKTTDTEARIVYTYAHLASLPNLIVGDEIKKGQVIATIGGSGMKRGKYDPHAYPDHLHMEVKLNDERIDPLEVFGLEKFTYDWKLIGQSARAKGRVEHIQAIDQYKDKVKQAIEIGKSTAINPKKLPAFVGPIDKDEPQPKPKPTLLEKTGKVAVAGVKEIPGVKVLNAVKHTLTDSLGYFNKIYDTPLPEKKRPY